MYVIWFFMNPYFFALIKEILSLKISPLFFKQVNILVETCFIVKFK